MERERGREKAESQKSTVSSGWSNSQNGLLVKHSHQGYRWRGKEEGRKLNPKSRLSQVDGQIVRTWISLQEIIELESGERREGRILEFHCLKWMVL